MKTSMKQASPFTPDWVIRAAVISKSEELRTRQQLQRDKVTGENAGRNDIYDAERHARWMYRLTREVGLSIGKAIGDMKEAWGLIKGAGGSETAMDFHNNEVGRRDALEGKPIPSRHRTEDLIYLDEKTGTPLSNGKRLAKLRAAAWGKSARRRDMQPAQPAPRKSPKAEAARSTAERSPWRTGSA